MPPALQRGAHGGDGGCTAAALVALGVWSTLAAAIAALDARIAPLHEKFLKTRGSCDESEAGVRGMQWHLEAMHAAIKAPGWHVEKLDIHPTHLVIGVTNNRWAIKKPNARLEWQSLKYPGYAANAPSVSSEAWHHTIAIDDGNLHDFSLAAERRAKGKVEATVASAMWLRDDDNQPDRNKGLMRTIRKVWRLSKCIASVGAGCRGQCKRKRGDAQQQ